MESIFEAIFEIIWELLLQVVFEVLAEFGMHSTIEVFKRRPNPWFAAVGHVLLGAIAGLISLLIFPALLIHSHNAQLASLFLTPLLAGGTMSLVGSWRRRRGQPVMRIDRFAYGYLFAVAMALVRFTLAK
jgi:FtsH-binding integral membrane protein